MRSEVLTVPPDLPVSDLVYQWVMGTDERAFPVMELRRAEMAAAAPTPAEPGTIDIRASVTLTVEVAPQ